MKKTTILTFLMLLFCLSNIQAQQFKISMSGSMRTKEYHMERNTSVTLTFYLAGNKSPVTKIYGLNDIEYNNGSWWKISENFVITGTITEIRCIGFHQDNPTGRGDYVERGRGKDSKTISTSDYPCINVRLANNFMGTYDNGSSVNISVEPVNIQINYFNDIQYDNDLTPGIKYLHENSPVKLAATSEYPKPVYSWEYAIGRGSSWKKLPDQFINPEGNEIRITGLDLLSYDQILNKNPVIFRINYNCGLSNEIELQPKIAAPSFKQILQKKPETCPGNLDGEVLFEFNRNLMTGEEVEIFAVNQYGDLVPLDYEVIGSNQCRISNLAPKEYTFQIVGSRIDHHGDKISTGIVKGDLYTFKESIDPGVELKFQILNQSGITCIDGSDGWITAKGEGGSGSYKLVCENEFRDVFESQFQNSTATVNNLPAGSYNVWMEDSNGCLTNVLQHGLVIRNPENPLEIEATDYFSPIGNDEDGIIFVNVKNGTPPYQAHWRKNNEAGTTLDSKAEYSGTNNQKSTLNNVGAGQYYVEFSDKNGCRVNTTITLEALPSFNIQLRQTGDIRCYGETTGQLEGEVLSGGTPPYRYEWYAVDSYSGSYKVGEGQILSEIGGGRYRLKIFDGEGRQTWSNVIEQTQPTSITANFQTERLKCYGDEDGYLEVSFAGGAGGYDYRWLTGDPEHTEQKITGLKAGNYQIEANDSEGCARTFTATIFQPDPISFSETLSMPSCNRLNNGNIQLNIRGGSSPYIIEWSNGGNTPNIQGLTAGNYNVSVSDKYGCTPANKELILLEPDILTANIQKKSNVSAFEKKDGNVIIAIEGGTPPYRATCKDSESRTYPVQGALYPTGQPATIEVKNLPTGNYALFIQDNFYRNNDPGYQSCGTSVDFTISEPPPISVEIEGLHVVSCYNGKNGKLEVKVEGGVPFDSGEAYHYKWFEVFGESKKLIPDSENKKVMNQLSPGKYTVEVSDQNNVSVFSSPYTLINPDSIRFKFNTAVLTCNTDASGWVEAAVTGGEGKYQYQWSSGERDTCRIENKMGGRYALTVKDERGCEMTDTATIISPPPLKTNFQLLPPLCDGHGDGFINLNISGGEAPYYYKWSTGDTTAFINNVYPGTYSVRIIDDISCYKDTTFIIPKTIPVSVKVDTIIQPLAFGYSDGTLRVKVTGGAFPYKIRWINDSGENIIPENIDIRDSIKIYTGKDSSFVIEKRDTTISILKNIPEGKYYIIVEDSNYQYVEQPSPYSTCGCLYTSSFYMLQPPKLEMEVVNTKNIQCFGTNDGQFIVHAKGGVPFKQGMPYTYQWYKNNIPIVNNDTILSDLGEGNYSIKITDANGISLQSESYFLKEPELLVLKTSAADLRCSLDTNGWVDASVTGGTKPYNYNWSNGAVTSRVENIPKGKYFLFVTDQHGCEISANASIIQPGGIVAEAEIIPPTCYNGSDGTIKVSLKGGEAPYTYHWDNGDKNLMHNNLHSGTHSLTVTDVNACSHEIFTYKLSQPDSIIIRFGKDITLCKGQVAELNATITEPALQYNWFDQSGKEFFSGPTVSLQDAGLYRAEVLTQKGCKGAGTIRITRTEKEISADFLVASEVPINDEVFVVHVSDPEPDSIQWILPEGEETHFQVLSNDSELLELIFSQYGEFTIGMKSYSEECEKVVYKTVRVMDKEAIRNYEDADEPMLKQFIVSPNPNEGYFSVSLELKESSSVTLQLVNSGTGTILEKRILKGSKFYNETFTIPGNAKGAYILNLYAPNAKSVKKVIVK